jgi:hypothetical protein
MPTLASDSQPDKSFMRRAWAWLLGAQPECAALPIEKPKVYRALAVNGRPTSHSQSLALESIRDEAIREGEINVASNGGWEDLPIVYMGVDRGVIKHRGQEYVVHATLADLAEHDRRFPAP